MRQRKNRVHQRGSEPQSGQALLHSGVLHGQVCVFLQGRCSIRRHPRKEHRVAFPSGERACFGNRSKLRFQSAQNRLTHDKGLLRKCVSAVGEDMPGGDPAMAARSMPQPCWEKVASIRSWTHWPRYRSREINRWSYRAYFGIHKLPGAGLRVSCSPAPDL